MEFLHMKLSIVPNSGRVENGNSRCPYLVQQHLPRKPVELAFSGLSVSVNKRSILRDVSGVVRPGELLAVMGPSGCGKTTLLNCLAGRAKINSGCIKLNGEKFSKKWKRRIGYVLQQDIFFPNLTLRQTLIYAARLRLPDTLSHSEKMEYVDHVINVLDLGNCQNTIIGDYLTGGLSGGEKKRANIACELLSNPSIMLLDEPTSGLDSHSAFKLMTRLKRYAETEGKTLVVAVHQPSSQIFHMFNELLLLCDGQTAYFGNVNKVVDYFNNMGLPIMPHYNPADFILEQVKGSEETKEKIIAAARDARRTWENRQQLLPDHLNSSDRFVNIYRKPNSVQNKRNLAVNGCHWTCDAWPTAGSTPRPVPVHVEMCFRYNTPTDSLYPLPRTDVITRIVKGNEGNGWLDNHSQDSSSTSSSSEDRCWEWPTSFWTQFRVLSERNFRDARPRMLSKLNWIQTVALGVIAGLLWFQLDRKEESLHDIQGWMFFSTNYWMLFAHFGALASFPSEREVINKERQSGSYRLSAYYLAKMVGELPLTITLPAVYYFISYPMLGCHSTAVFAILLGFLLLNTIVAQSVGFFVATCCTDMQVSITISALYTLVMQLFGGYLATNIPSWMKWMKYVSMINYAYQNMQIVEFGDGGNIQCALPSKFEVCNSTSQYIPVEAIMEAQGGSFPLWANSLVLLLFLFIFRFLGYIVLRVFRRPE